MSGWDFEEVGDFGSHGEAVDWGRRNGVAPADLDIKGGFGSGVKAYVRRSATDKSESELKTSSQRGFF
jgi:hypothetical protein